ncbi:MAG: hypothetical protein R2705_20710 [Ilumatobacteraceae bacterium]
MLSLVAVAPAALAPSDLRDRVLRSVADRTAPHPSDPSREPTAPRAAPPAPGTSVEHWDGRGFPGPAATARRLARLAVAAVAILAIVFGGGALAVTRWQSDAGSRVAASTGTEPAALAPTTVPNAVASSGSATAAAPDEPAPNTEVDPPQDTTRPTAVPEVLEPPDPTDPPTVTDPPRVTDPPQVTDTPTVPPTPEVTVAATPARLEVSTTFVDLGSTATSASFQLSNTGGTALSWSFGGSWSPFSISPANGSIAPGASTAISVSIDRATSSEGTTVRVLEMNTDAATSTASVIEVASTTSRPPAVEILRADTEMSCPITRAASVAAQVTDDSALSSVVLQWNGPGGDGTASMSAGRTGWAGTVPVTSTNGTWRYAVLATDSFGNQGVASGTVTVSGCGSLAAPG